MLRCFPVALPICSKVAKSQGVAVRLTDIYLFSQSHDWIELLFSRISSWVSLFFQIKRFSDSKVVLVIMFHAEHIPFHCIVCDNHLPRHVAQSFRHFEWSSFKPFEHSRSTEIPNFSGALPLT